MQTEGLLKQFINSSVDAIVILDCGYKIIVWNERAEQLFGIPAIEAVKMTISDIIPPKLFPEFEYAFIRLKQNKQVDNFIIDLPGTEGNLFSASIGMTTMKNENTYSGYALVIREVSEQKRNENRLRKREEDLRLFFDFNPNYCYMISPEGIILDVNREALLRLGYKKEELIGSSITVLYPPESKVKMEMYFNAWKITGEIREKEITIVTKEGDRRIVLLSVTSIKDYDGKVLHSMSIQQDITDLRNAQYRLSKAEEIAHLGSWQLNLANGGELIWSDEVYRILGLDKQVCEATYDNLMNAIHPEDRKKVNDAYAMSLEKNRNTYDIEHRIIKADTGEVRFVHEQCEHIRNTSGNIVRSIGMIQDITEQKKLTLGYERFFQAVQHSSNAVVITDVNGKITHINRAFEKLYGYSPEEAYGKTPNILNPGRLEYYNHGYTEARYNRLFEDMWKSIQDPANGAWDGEVLNRKKDGRIIKVYLYINAIRSWSGQINGFVGLPIDVTNQRKMEEKVRIQTYSTIADLAEARDNETGLHMKRIGVYGKLMAEHLNMPKQYCKEMLIFAPLHDIGKVGIPDNILLAPRKLSDDEFTIMKQHAIIGYQILKNRETMEMAADIVYGHHEKFDGSGYPNKMKGKDIPLSARITALVDVYDALRSKRPYKQPFSHEKAVQIILQGKGGHFDPDLVDLFLKLQDEFVRIFDLYSDE